MARTQDVISTDTRAQEEFCRQRRLKETCACVPTGKWTFP